MVAARAGVGRHIISRMEGVLSKKEAVMARRLSQNLNSDYVQALNRLNGKKARRKIVAYVESFDDIFFWRTLLHSVENERYYFEVMLPSRSSLGKGKKVALSNRLGKYMIACVDADYDYLMQGVTPTSQEVCTNPYVFHTIVYAIENYECYAPTLHNVCVMSTLNDHRIFDFETFMKEYSQTIWPLFVWNVWAYRYGKHKQFSLLDFYKVVGLDSLNYYHPEHTLNHLRHLVNSKIARLHKLFPQGKESYKPFMERLLHLGVTPENCYLYMRGHDLHDGVVAPMLAGVCEVLRREREREIRDLAEHEKQFQNELAAYQHAVSSVAEMLRKHTAYTVCPQYQEVVQKVKDFLRRLEQEENAPKGPTAVASASKAVPHTAESVAQLTPEEILRLSPEEIAQLSELLSKAHGDD